MGFEVSVLMSIFNEEKQWIKESIESIMAQTFNNFELIIIVDNPQLDKDTEKYLSNLTLQYPNIIILKNDKNIGLALSLNRGIQIARGEYIARMDADDVCNSQRFERELAFLKDNNFDMVFTNKNLIDESSQIIESSENYKFNNSNLSTILELYNCVVHPSVLIKKSVLVDLGGYRNFKQAQDYDLWLRMLSKGFQIGVIDQPLINYRIRKNSISQSRALLQFLTAEYQKKLYYQRKKRGYDNFSEKNFDTYLKKYNAFDLNRNTKFGLACDNLNYGLKMVKEKNIVGICFIFKGIMLDFISIKKFKITMQYREKIKNSIFES